MRRAVRRVIVVVLLAIVLLAGTGRAGPVSPVAQATASYERDLVRWEATHFLDKWWHLATRAILPRTPSTASARAEGVTEFFALAAAQHQRQQALEQAIAAAPSAATAAQASAQTLQEISTARSRQLVLQPGVEQTLESVIAAAADELGLARRAGSLRWPPVDFTFEPNGLLLVRSPRHEVRRLPDTLLRADVDLLSQQTLERDVEAGAPGTTALVVRIGGVATYPAQVSPNVDLHDTLILASHEWLHHHLFFTALGQRWGAGGALTSINETVANIAGEELGDRAYERFTGRPVDRPPWRPPAPFAPAEPEPGVFDFRREMRGTRLRLDELLALGRTAEAETYLEERRQRFVAEGHALRRLSTAYFAFHGTYGDSPASGASPIEPQLRAVRAGAGSLQEFLRRVGRITDAARLEAMAREAGWRPDA